MNLYKLYLIFFIFGVCSSLDLCKSYQNYPSCIASDNEKCMWDNIRTLCYQTNDYLQGCSLMLNKNACLRQIGDVFGKLSKCRFNGVCEDIPNLTTEKCYNNLSKSGCLSINNPEQVCIWQNDTCIGLSQALWGNIQDDFASVSYSASACSHIKGYLVMHHTMLWDLISYTPDLVTEADNIYKKELGIQINESVEYDDPSSVFMQNNYVMQDGKFAWYTIRVSKSITLTNLQKTSRTREGCIALEIESDSDFTTIFRLTGDVRGVNHVYCKYLNKNPSITDTYVFQNGGCSIFKQSNLGSQDLISLLDCSSLNLLQCIYFDSPNYSCQITSESYEFPCITSKYPTPDGAYSHCNSDGQCSNYTNQQCKQMEYYYIDETANQCVNTCLKFTDQSSCISPCIYVGSGSDVIANVCAPTRVCNQIGLNKKGCLLMKAKCAWNDSISRCYELSNDEINYMKCSDALNIYVCTLITISDQLCFWEQTNGKCINILDQPLLITHFIFINSKTVDNTICNMNLCKYNDRVATEYDPNKRVCNFITSTFNDDKGLINKYRCIMDMPGYCLWDVTQQICVCLTETQLKLRQCTSLVNVNEKLCQKALVSQASLICIYDSNTNSCLEKTELQVDAILCSGNGLSESQCVKKNNNGEYCQYSAGVCQRITVDSINSIRCTSLQKVNEQVCKMQTIYQVICIYDSITHSCYSPSLFNNIAYSLNINSYACQAVTGTYTFYDQILHQCYSFDGTDTILTRLTCENQYVNILSCEHITTPGQFCYWNSSLNRCRNYVESFNNCNEFSAAPARVCQALETSVTTQFLKENYCTYANSLCATNSNYLTDCGEAEQMNIHRCAGMTGLDGSGNPSSMCAFVNYHCKSLTSGDMDTMILLETIDCIQANMKTCTSVITPGQYCFVVNYVSSNSIIIDKKCKPITSTTESCSTINSSYSVSLINPTHCSRALDSCYYTVSGCAQPASTTLYCDTQGLSQIACIFNTQDNRCAFVNSQCQQVAEFTALTDCTVLNKFTCLSNFYLNCSWDDVTGCAANIGLYINDYTCSMDTTSTFLISDGTQCITVTLENDYSKYTCDSPGLNQYACLRIPNQFCVFRNNQCTFHIDELCEDTTTTCSSNDSTSLTCALLNNECLLINNPLYECDFFDQSNYLFCQEYPECVYSNNKCKQRIQQVVLTTCSNLDEVSCTIQNKSLSCQYQYGLQQCIPYSVSGTECPSLIGFFSYQVCNSYTQCQFGYTKSGYGFCYSGANFSTLTCASLNQVMCLEDLAHLNQGLLCYWDTSCKSVTNNVATCQDLQPFQSSYSACTSFGVNSCMYSHIDHKCKSMTEYSSTICSGISLLECNKVEAICYFDGSNCSGSGTDDQLNKYGCITKTGNWNYVHGLCIAITASVVDSCNNLSQNACISDLTQQLHCRWLNNKCHSISEHENKQINSCSNLNQKACLNVRLSSVQCSWNATTKNCDSITVSSSDCTLSGQSNTSLSLCGSQENTDCVRYQDGTKCSQITVNLSDCNKYGLNQQSCLTLTTVPCQWKQINGAGYCEVANLYQISCSDLLNQYACQQVKSLGQYCKWDTNQCITQVITNCASANNLNGLIACKAVTTQPCEYDEFTNKCSTVVISPLTCSDRYNVEACKMSVQSCSWSNNTCVSDSQVFECSKLLNQQLCLTNSEQSCKWIENKCTDFRLLDIKIFCKNLPQNINDFACRINSIDPCFFDTIVYHCIPAQKAKSMDPSSNADNLYVTVSELMQLQTPTYVSPLFVLACEELSTMNDCIASRKQGQACQWISDCRTITDFNSLQCTQQFNIYGCLGITTSNQFCQWTDQCIVWNSTKNIMTNVNINVCISHSINSVYMNNSCRVQDLSTIECTSLGISKITCLSATNRQCQWLNNNCSNFTESNQTKCSDYSFVSPYVCQMQSKYSCTYDPNTQSCINAPQNSLVLGTSMLACLSNTQVQTFWNIDKCDTLSTTISCDTQLQVNALVCQSVVSAACGYNSITKTCSSKINSQSLRCNTLGLNFYGCLLVTQEPCIFKNNTCQQFTSFSASCMTLTNVNAQACASLVNQQCIYDSIDHRCQTPFLSINYCSLQGVNKDVCENNVNCKWNNDHRDCKCSADQEPEQCQAATVTDCKLNSQCYFDQNKCVRKQCYHLSINDCTTAVLDGKTCYISSANICQPAKSCEDIVDPRDLCSSIYIKSIPCVQAYTSCISASNFELYCPYSDCLNTNCYYEYGVCRKKRCTDYGVADCLNHAGCYFDKQQTCQVLINCSQIDVATYGDANVLNICNQLSVNGFKCNYQKFALLDDTLICTNQPCELYGPSSTLCQGNEMNGYSCVLSGELSCKQCEQITEKCYCNSQPNICTFANGKCVSILCSSFLTKEICGQASNRCYWSTSVQDSNGVVSEGCVKECTKIIESAECENRVNECYYEYLVGQCLKGQKVVPSLQLDITIEPFYGVMVSTLTLILYALQ